MAAESGGLCLVHGRIVDGTGRDPLDDGFVRIADGRIVEVGPMSGFSRPRDVAVVDVSGRTVLPGLIDCHAHLVYFPAFKDILEIDACPPELATIYALLNAERILRAGYTTMRDVGSIGQVSVRTREAVNRGLMAGPRILACGPAITGSGGFTDNLPSNWRGEVGLGLIRDGAEAWIAATRRLCSTGVDVVKLGTSGVEVGRSSYTWMTVATQEEVSAATREAHLRGCAVAVHCESYEGAKIALRAGADTVEHGTRLDEEAIDLFLAGDAVLVPTLCTLFGTLEAADKASIFPKRLDEMAVNERLWVDSLLAAKERGVPIAAGGDIGTRIPHGKNARELEYLVRVGFSPMEALVAATSGAARAIRREGLVGTLEAGRFGDVTVVEGDPLDDIRVLQEEAAIRMVFKSGRLAAGAERDDLGPLRMPTESLSSGILGEAWARLT
jgi:imidazolonepropionase-like amidohydrolase